ncbi:hypothetical protein BGX34_010707 [Mortierella sp. NVP85]|nr:hypothetical protein BGX34_010707 [Mortierella sp. NVP85]
MAYDMALCARCARKSSSSESIFGIGIIYDMVPSYGHQHSNIHNIRFDITALVLTALVAVQTWDVNIVDGMFEPAILNIAPGDTVRWPLNDGADHAIVQTIDGARSCISKISGRFNSGRKTPGKAYQQTFRQASVVNYKDGIGANCFKGAVGTIFVGSRPDNATETAIAPPAASTRAGSGPNSSVVATITTAPLIATTVAHTTVITTVPRVLTTLTLIPTPTPSDTPNAASGLSTKGSLFLGVASVIGALFVL